MAGEAGLGSPHGDLDDPAPRLPLDDRRGRPLRKSRLRLRPRRPRRRREAVDGPPRHDAAAALVGCSWEDWHPIEGAGSVWCFGTRVAAFLGADESALLWLGACYLDGIAGAYVSAYGAGASRVHVVGDTLISQGASVDSDTTLKLGKVCVRHNSADALICWAGRLRISDATKVYGSGNTNQILVLAGGTVGIYSATGLAGLIATSSAAVMDFRNSKTKAWADLPFVANALPADSQAMLILQ